MPDALMALRIGALDAALFEPIASQTTAADRRSLLLAQHLVRRRSSYVYLEIGSYLGGTLQTHYADPRCEAILSIDRRLPVSPDIRGRRFHYADNSTATMMASLLRAYPEIDGGKVSTFDCDAADVPSTALRPRPSLCFIDGEHTIPATLSDFAVCLRAAAPDAVILFHDTNLVFGAIESIEASLADAGRRFSGLLLEGSVYVILLDDAVEWYATGLRAIAQDARAKFSEWHADLEAVRAANRWRPSRIVRNTLSARFPRIFGAARALRNVLRP